MPNLPQLSGNQIFACGVLVIFALSFILRRVRRWWVSSFDYLPDFLMAVQAQFISVFWGESIGTGIGHVFGVAMPFLILAIYSQFKTPEPFINWVAVISDVLIAGYYVWRADHLRLEQKIDIPRLRTQEWVVAQGNAGAGHNAKAYYFEVVNMSEGATIEDVNVQLNRIIPEVPNLDWLPINLRLKHDSPAHGERYARSFNLNPREVKTIDFVSALQGNTVFTVEHIVGMANHTVFFDTEGHRLQVLVTGKNMPALLVWFRVWRDELGLIQCEMEENEESGNDVGVSDV